MEGTTMNKEARTVDESRVETIHIVRPNHLNGANRLFGGILMQWIDEVAGIVAKRHSMCNVTTASVDNLTFLHGAYQNEMVVIKGKLTWVGSSSMEVCVDTYVETLSGEQHRINNAHFMMVALDENDRPARVPRLILQTEDEKLAWAHGEERRRIRAQRKEAKLDGI
jgi:acyl-CoA hydrolase